MKARLHLTGEWKKQTNEYVHQQVMKERSDIATRSLYLVLLAMYQAGLSPRTMRRVQSALDAVIDKYAEYKTEKLADDWARITLQGHGVEVRETSSKM